MNELSKEYLFLFNAMVYAAEDMGALLLWVSTIHDQAKQTRKKGDVDKAVEIMFGALRKLEIRLQQFQLMFIQAQQRAEELYLDGGE